jgi:predicted RNA-binding Zn ribbon-like protein
MMLVMVAHADQSAPGQLEMIRGFVNTLDVEHDTDELSTGGAASSWLTENSLPGGERSLAGDELERLIAVREALRELLLANNSGEPPPPAALATLNEQSADAAIGLRFTAAGGELITRCEGADSSIARLLAIVHEAISDQTWLRLKVCPADDCRWAFYDQSRNRSGTWCDMGHCGNRAKARAYRERHRQGHGR